MSNSPLKLINLWGAAGIGKSGCASGLFNLMKSEHVSVQLVTEAAKDMQLSGQGWRLAGDQLGIFGEQQYRQLVLKGKYEWAITDSPLPLCAFYGARKYPDSFYALVQQTFDEYENTNFFLWRDLDGPEQFETVGRTQDRDESKRLQDEMPVFMRKQGINFATIEIRGAETSWELLDAVLPGLKRAPLFDRTLSDARQVINSAAH
jgi:hypothetical protein